MKAEAPTVLLPVHHHLLLREAVIHLHHAHRHLLPAVVHHPAEALPQEAAGLRQEADAGNSKRQRRNYNLL